MHRISSHQIVIKLEISNKEYTEMFEHESNTLLIVLASKSFEGKYKNILNCIKMKMPIIQILLQVAKEMIKSITLNDCI